MLIPSKSLTIDSDMPSLSRRVNANSQLGSGLAFAFPKLIKKGEC